MTGNTQRRTTCLVCGGKLNSHQVAIWWYFCRDECYETRLKAKAAEFVKRRAEKNGRVGNAPR